MAVRFDGQVAVVTGAGAGLGRTHALALAARGAKVLVNDLGSATDGTGASSEAARGVVAEITGAGGEAIANGANVARFDDVEAMVAEAMDAWGRVDVLVNNAGILRDKSFAKMDLSDFQAVMDVHLGGSVNCSKAVWGIMQEQEYGRIVMTTSSSGLYGNFGQANYAAAKMALVGLMNTLGIEGAKYDIRVNTLGPGAATRMTDGLLTEEVEALFRPEPVSEAMIALCHSEAPSRCILNAQAGSYSVTRLVESHGKWLAPEQQTAEQILASWPEISGTEGETVVAQGFDHVAKMVELAKAGMGGG